MAQKLVATTGLAINTNKYPVGGRYLAIIRTKKLVKLILRHAPLCSDNGARGTFMDIFVCSFVHL